MSIERIAVVGAVGVMGRGIARVGAMAGFELRLHGADAGHLGKKSGRGIYEYDEDRNILR